MKDMFDCSLDVNIPVQTNIAEKRLFNHAVEIIKYYYPVQLLTPTKSVLIWLTQLSPLIGPLTNISENCSKSNGNMSNVGSGNELGMEEKLFTDSDCTESKGLSHNYGKSNGNMSDGRSSKEIGTEEKPFTDSDHTESKSLCYNCGKSNGNISNRGAGKGLEIKDLESLK